MATFARGIANEAKMARPERFERSSQRSRQFAFALELRLDGPAAPTAQWDRKLSPLKVSPKREFLRFCLETFGRFSPELPLSGV